MYFCRYNYIICNLYHFTCNLASLPGMSPPRHVSYESLLDVGLSARPYFCSKGGSTSVESRDSAISIESDFQAIRPAASSFSFVGNIPPISSLAGNHMPDNLPRPYV